jgi:hypothetical protein
MPAAVVSIGKYRLISTAASRTPLYPPILAIDESVSIAWARVVRGIASVEKAVTPLADSARTASR